jgi:hypothetical protein
MMTARFLFLATALLALGSTDAFGASKSASNTVEEVRALYKSTNKKIARGHTVEVQFAATPDQYARNVWTMPSSKKDFLESACRAVAYIEGKAAIIKVSVDVKSDSGDWSSHREYYFRRDGRTAFIYEKYSTFQAYDFVSQKELPEGPYTVEKRRYFDALGNQIRALDKAFVESTKQPVQARFVHVVDLDSYRGVQNLPFYKKLLPYISK